jgi:hypothetical protein
MTAVYGALFGVLCAVLLSAGIAVYCGVQEIGFRPKELLKGLAPILRDRRLKKPLVEMALWFGSYGLLIGMVLSSGALKYAAVFILVCYIAITMLYRYAVARRQGVGYQPRAHWKQFWAVREHIDELKKVDRKAYTTFYAASIFVGLFWYWIGIFDSLVK